MVDIYIPNVNWLENCSISELSTVSYKIGMKLCIIHIYIYGIALMNINKWETDVIAPISGVISLTI